MPFIQENYYTSSNQIFFGYNVLILSKFYVNFYCIKFENSFQSRNLTFAEINFVSEDKTVENVLVGTAHLESMGGNQRKRIEQLNSSFKILNYADNAFFMGDFNFDPTEKEEESICKKFDDSWKIYKTMKNLDDDEGVTRPMEKEKHVRFDRMLFKSKNSKIFVEQFEMIGKDKIDVKIKYDSKINTPSDHFGIYTKFKLK